MAPAAANARTHPARLWQGRPRLHRPLPTVICKAAVPSIDGVPTNLLLTKYRELCNNVFRFLQSGQRQDYNFFLQGNYRAVDREIWAGPQDLEIVGAVPAELQGWYIKTGPNAQFDPHGAYHWFDGEGMLHAVVLGDGTAKSYHNHWVKCFRFMTEKAAGRNVFMRIGDMRGLRGLVMLLMRDHLHFLPRAPRLENEASGNTSVVFHNGRLLALNEGSLPFQLQMLEGGRLRSLGSHSYDAGLTHEMCAHPKIDPVTGDMIFFGNASTGKGRLTYNTVSAEGEVSPDVHIDLPQLILAHDFAITTDYAIFLDHNLAFDAKEMITRDTLPFKTDTSRPGRIGLLQRRHPTRPVRWFDVDPYACFHTANAWQEGDLVHLVCCRYEHYDMAQKVTEPQRGRICRYTLDTATGASSLTTLCPDRILDFPAVAPQLVGQRSKFAWCTEAQGLALVALVKVDGEAAEGAGEVGRIAFPPGWCGGEAVFVPRDSAALSAGRAAPDDGYLVCYVTDEVKLISYCMIYDAATMASEPLAQIRLPQRVPFNFHGTFVPNTVLEAGQRTKVTPLS